MRSTISSSNIIFSNRFSFPTTPNRWYRSLSKQKENGERLFDLAISNPTAAGFSWNLDILYQAIHDKRICSYIPNSRGLLESRIAISQFYQNVHTANISPEHIHLSASTSESYSWLLKLLCDPGDEILMPMPSYPLISVLCAIESVNVKSYSLLYNSNTNYWEIDFDSLLKNITPKTKAIFLVNPNNPTGSSLSANERERILKLSTEKNIPIIVDEVFLEYTAQNIGTKILSFAKESTAPIFVLGGLSKTAALPQIKAGWILICGNKKFQEKASQQLDFIADSFLSISTMAQISIAPLLQHSLTIREKIIERLETNEKLLKIWTSQNIHDLKLYKRQAGWYAITQLPRGIDEENFILDLLNIGKTIVHPGHFYDLELNPHPHLVFSLIANTEDYQKALPRIDETLLRQ